MEVGNYLIATGNVIRKLRIEKNFTIEYIAKRLGVPQKHIVDAEKGLGCTFLELLALAEVYRIDYVEIMRLIKEEYESLS